MVSKAALTLTLALQHSNWALRTNPQSRGPPRPRRPSPKAHAACETSARNYGFADRLYLALSWSPSLNVDGVVLPDIAVVGLRILRRVPLAAMVFETQHPAGLQRPIRSLKASAKPSCSQLKVAKGDDQIGRAGRGDAPCPTPKTVGVSLLYVAGSAAILPRKRVLSFSASASAASLPPLPCKAT